MGVGGRKVAKRNGRGTHKDSQVRSLLLSLGKLSLVLDIFHILCQKGLRFLEVSVTLYALGSLLGEYWDNPLSLSF